VTLDFPLSDFICRDGVSWIGVGLGGMVLIFSHL
jgi:hypothetical protein